MKAHRSIRAMPHVRRRARAAGPLVSRALGAALLAAALAACEPHVDGNGVFLEEDWSGLPAFEGVQVEDGVEAIVTVGGQKSVKLSGDENVVSKVAPQVIDDAETGVKVLRVRVEESYTTFHPLRLVVTVPALSLIRASGHSDDTETSVDASGVQAAALRVSIADRARVVVQGAGTGGTSTLLATVSGHSTEEGVAVELDARSYPVAAAEVALSGGARAWVKASQEVTGSAASGTVIRNFGVGACLVVDGQGEPLTCE